MYGHTFIWIFCLISTVCSMFQNIQTNIPIDQSVQLGTFINIGRNVTLKPFSAIGSFASIAPNTIIDEYAMVGSYSGIADNCYIAKGVNIQTFTMIGSGSNIGPETNVRDYCTVGNNAKIGSLVTLLGNVRVGNYAQLGDNSILDAFSVVGDGVSIMSKGYIGRFSFIGPNSIVGESAVVLNFVGISNGGSVKYNEVIMRTPSSFELYLKCDPNFSNMIIKTTPNTNGAASPEFNNQMRQSINEQINRLSTNCAQTNEPTQPTSLPQIIAMYLNEFHGPDRFKAYVQQVRQMCNGRGMSNVFVGGGQSQVFINGVRMDTSTGNAYDSTISQLKNEFHFGENSRKILEPSVENIFVQLLAIDQDLVRDIRDKNDSRCRMIGQIQNGERNVRCANPSTNPNGNTNFC